jgi:pyridinium-3,5-biscarboxylic acid mononucleotide synthase
MDSHALRQLIADVADGTRSADDVVAQLQRLPYADLGFARVDHHRPLRQGLPEAVYGPGKTPDQCASIVLELLVEGLDPVILSRADDAQVEAAIKTTAQAVGRATREGSLDEATCTAHVTTAGGRSTVSWRHASARPGGIVIITAGTSDLPVAYECRAVLEALGYSPSLIADCGVAGLHRLLAVADDLAKADVVVAVAGMEGALASVVGGLCAAPVVAVPTSVGYGSSFDGITALLAMMASCASGISVVGIDNGFGAACAVARMLP